MQEIKCQVIETLWSDGSGPGHHEVRIVRWNDAQPVVEKRQYFTDRATGQVRPGKSKGFNLDDLRRLKSSLDKVCETLRANLE